LNKMLNIFIFDLNLKWEKLNLFKIFLNQDENENEIHQMSHSGVKQLNITKWKAESYK
jgi:hypothetical protein